MDLNFTPPDYRDLLFELLRGQCRGSKKEFSSRIGIQQAYLCRVLDKDAHLSLEQAERTARTLGLRVSEVSEFVDLVGFARAGTAELRQHFLRRISPVSHLLLGRVKLVFKCATPRGPRMHGLRRVQLEHETPRLALARPPT